MDKFIEFFWLSLLTLQQCLHNKTKQATFLVSLIFSLVLRDVMLIDIITEWWSEMNLLSSMFVLAWSSVVSCPETESRDLINVWQKSRAHKIRNYKHMICHAKMKWNSISWKNIFSLIKSMKSTLLVARGEVHRKQFLMFITVTLTPPQKVI